MKQWRRAARNDDVTEINNDSIMTGGCGSVRPNIALSRPHFFGGSLHCDENDSRGLDED